MGRYESVTIERTYAVILLEGRERFDLQPKVSMRYTAQAVQYTTNITPVVARDKRQISMMAIE